VSNASIDLKSRGSDPAEKSVKRVEKNYMKNTILEGTNNSRQDE
jgi:hypothetical protein